MPSKQEIANHAKTTGKLKLGFGYRVFLYLSVPFLILMGIKFMLLAFSEEFDFLALILSTLMFVLAVLPIIGHLKYSRFTPVHINAPVDYIFTQILEQCEYYYYTPEFVSKDMLVIYVMYGWCDITIVADDDRLLVNAFTPHGRTRFIGQPRSNWTNREVILDIIEEADIKYMQTMAGEQ